MIVISNGKAHLKGNKVDLAVDLSCIVRSLLEAKMFTKDEVMYAVELGCKDKETVRKEVQETLNRIFDVILKGNKNEQVKTTDEDLFNKMFGDLKDE